MSAQQTPLLTACLIVKNEQDVLAECLHTLATLVDEIIVVDTGSSDSTVNIARAAGATVTTYPWTNDFAAARNAALAQATGTWVLSIDADERIQHTTGLRQLLIDAPADCAGWEVWIDNVSTEPGAGGYRHHMRRLFRRDGAHWTGKAHEQLTAAPGQRFDAEPLCPEHLLITHLGYASEQQQAEKAARNLALAAAELHEPGVSASRAAQVLTDIGRSSIAIGQFQQALEAFTEARALDPNSAAATHATDFLVRLLLAAGHFDAAEALVADLSAAGVDAQYCTFLRAQAWLQQGRVADADQALSTVHRIVDAAGRQHSSIDLHQAAAMAAALCGDHARALDRALLALAEPAGVNPSTISLLRELAALSGIAPTALLERVRAVTAPAHHDVLAAQLS